MQEESTASKKTNRSAKKKFGMGMVILAILLAIVLYQGKVLIGGKQSVRGEKTENQPSFSLPSSSEVKSAIEQKVGELQKEVSNLSPLEVATTSPQVQKILRDIKALEGYPRNQAREFCENLCRNL